MKNKVIVLSLSILGLIFIACLNSIYFFKDNKITRQPASQRMRYILFPINSSVTLQRAILINGKELYDDNIFFEYFDGENKLHIKKKEMTLQPPEENMLKKYIWKLNEEISKWGIATDFCSVDFHMHYDNGPVHIRLHCKGGKTLGFIYNIQESLTPSNCFEEIVY